MTWLRLNANCLIVGILCFMCFISWQLVQQNIKLSKLTHSTVIKYTHVAEDTCSLDYINNKRLPQDHPCIIHLIRSEFLIQPSPAEVPLNLVRPEIVDPSAGQVRKILDHLQNKTNGFFLECGALEGEWLSNTLYMERYLGWTGLLIEAIPKHFQKLYAKHRKSWTLPACISLEPYPVLSQFVAHSALGHGSIRDIHKNNQDQQIIYVQCFPLYSILLAVNRTTIDFFSLDVEGHELMILKTIPWHKVDIQTLTVEWVNIREGQGSLISYMKSVGYDVIGENVDGLGEDVLFAKRIKDHLSQN